MSGIIRLLLQTPKQGSIRGGGLQKFASGDFRFGVAFVNFERLSGGLSMAPMNAFIAEHNVEIYLSRLHETWDGQARDTLLRLLADEVSRMGLRREHLDGGERRVVDGRLRIERQQELIARLLADGRPTEREASLLETLEKTQALLEAHVEALRRSLEDAKL